MIDATLILEGGGLRGVYTSGVLRALADHGIFFSRIIAVSMGACNASNYIAGQFERNRRVNIEWLSDPRYLSWVRWLSGGELFGMDFLFGDLPLRLDPFAMDAFLASPVRFHMVATDCHTGEAVYREKSALGRAGSLSFMRASCSLPFAAPPVPFEGRLLMDGGMADSIPLEWSLAQGHDRHLAVLTRPAGYRKRPTKWALAARRIYRRLPGIARRLGDRHIRYNRALDRLAEEDAAGRAVVIRPGADLLISRTGRNHRMLYKAYDRGWRDAETMLPVIERRLAGGDG
ncbi:MAG: patatin family protein [Desulfobacterales bacterium]|nr:MAG: patatin family protein [Desulfobacterales bacterium]